MSSSRCASAIAFLLLCAAGHAVAQVKGTATYRDRMALPPGAVFEATLEDVSRADAKAEVIGRVRIEQAVNPPFAFEIPYDALYIDPRRRYSVRARISVAGRLLFTTVKSYPVISAGHGTEVALELRRVDQASNEPLENTYWKLVRLGDEEVRAAPNQREAHFVLHRATRHISGAGGCNRMTGNYDVEGERLAFDRLATTMMACAQGMEAEKKFLAVLQQTRRAKVTLQQLELLDAEARVVATLEAVHLR